MTRRMRDLREDHDYTQQYVAYKLGIDQRAYSVYETGKRKMPVNKLYLLCELYGVSMDYLVGRSSKKNVER
ncbi:MAG: helix-turn-helix transcriptional regulator [Lachnospiraceae bacterium]|nr:helix-turn-helix transcriptional regulator [Lachnospiraceae bacterium]